MYGVADRFGMECESAPFGAAWLGGMVARCDVAQKAGARCRSSACAAPAFWKSLV